MRKRYKIIIITSVAIVAIIIILLVAMFLIDNTIQFTGEVQFIDRETGFIRLMNMDTGAIFELEVSTEFINTIDIGCNIDVYWSGRIEIIGECLVIV